MHGLVVRYALAACHPGHLAAKLVGIDASGLNIEEKALLAIFAHINVGVDTGLAESAEGLGCVLLEYHTAHIKQNILYHSIYHYFSILITDIFNKLFWA